jgi:hypothetical protein
MPKVRCAAACLGGIIKGNHEGIKSTGWPTSVVSMTYRLRRVLSSLIGLLSGMDTYVWKRSAL